MRKKDRKIKKNKNTPVFFFSLPLVQPPSPHTPHPRYKLKFFDVNR